MRSISGFVCALFVITCFSLQTASAQLPGGQKVPKVPKREKAQPAAAKGHAPAAKGRADFDALSRAVTKSDALEDLEELYGEAFKLREWYFVARGKFPDVRPYIASNKGASGGRYMVRAFTDTDRLFRFARENGLTEGVNAGDESALILSIPTDKVIEYLEQFIAQGAYGVWFNSDSKSDGFYVPLKQLRPIREHLESKRPRRR